MSLKYFLILIIASFLINFSLQVTSFSYMLDINEEFCVHEYLSDKTLVVFEIYSTETETQFTIIDPDRAITADKKNTRQFKESFTTLSGGYYEVCIENHSTTAQARIDFDMKHGVAAKDYSSVAKSKDLKPMELDVKYFLIPSYINLMIKVKNFHITSHSLTLMRKSSKIFSIRSLPKLPSFRL